MTTFVEGLLAYVGFFFVTVASSQLAIVFPRIKLPLITGYLFVGVLAGPYVLNFVTTEQIKVLAYINQFVLAFIGFSAGAELYLPELRELFKLILLSVGAISFVTFLVVTLIVNAMMNGGMVAFVSDLSSNCIFGISLLFGAIMTARSPASAIAIVKETRAKGPFTKAFLGITVVSDLVVLVLFAMALSICRAQCDGKGFNWESIGTMIVSLVFSILFGYFVLGKLVVFLLFLKPHVKVSAKWLIIPLGFGLFLVNGELTDFTLQAIGHEFSIEPLLMCIVAGYVATNQSRNRRFFLQMLQGVGPYVFIPFFTLTGAGLNLKVLITSFPLAAVVAIARMTTIAVGSVVGGAASKAPRRHNIFMWMALVTQAGVSLGLAGEIAFLFVWGPECATTIVAVVLINQIVGPILCKLAIKKVGEDGKASGGQGATGLLGVRTAVLFGVNEYTLTLADKLQSGHWKVKFIDVPGTDFKEVKELNLKNIKEHELHHGHHHEAPVSSELEKSTSDVEMLPTITETTTTSKPQPAPAHHEEEEEEEEEKIWEIKIEELQTLPLTEEETRDHDGPAYNFNEASSGTHKSQDVIVLSLSDDTINLIAGQYFVGQKFKKVIAVVNDPLSASNFAALGILPLYMQTTFDTLLFQYVISNADQVSLSGLAKGDNVNANHHRHHIGHPERAISVEIKATEGEHESKGINNFMKKQFQSFKDAADVVKGTTPNNMTSMHMVEDDQREEYLDALADSQAVTPIMSFSLFDSKQKANAPITTDKKHIEESFRSSYSVFDEYNQMSKDDEHHDQ